MSWFRFKMECRSPSFELCLGVFPSLRLPSAFLRPFEIVLKSHLFDKVIRRVYGELCSNCPSSRAESRLLIWRSKKTSHDTTATLICGERMLWNPPRVPSQNGARSLRRPSLASFPVGNCLSMELGIVSR